MELRLLPLLLCACTTFERQPTFSDGGVSTTAETIADRRAHPQDLVVRDGFVMWVDLGSYSLGGRDGQLLRAPVDGCHDASCPSLMADTLNAAAGVTLSLDRASLYYSEAPSGNQGRISQITFGADETPKPFAMAQGGPRKLAADESALYWVNGNSGEVRRQWLDMGTPGGLVIVAMQDSPVEITVDITSARVFWTNFGASEFDGSVHAADLDGLNERTLAPAQSSPRGISMGTTHLFWANFGNGTVMRSLPNGMETGAFASDRLAPNDVLVDGDWLYVAEAGTAPYYQDGRIVAMKLDGSTQKTLAENQKYPRSLAVDLYAVYWVNIGTWDSDQYDGAVMRVAKP